MSLKTTKDSSTISQELQAKTEALIGTLIEKKGENFIRESSTVLNKLSDLYKDHKQEYEALKNYAKIIPKFGALKDSINRINDFVMMRRYQHPGITTDMQKTLLERLSTVKTEKGNERGILSMKLADLNGELNQLVAAKNKAIEDLEEKHRPAIEEPDVEIREITAKYREDVEPLIKQLKEIQALIDTKAEQRDIAIKTCERNKERARKRLRDEISKIDERREYGDIEVHRTKIFKLNNEAASLDDKIGDLNDHIKRLERSVYTEMDDSFLQTLPSHTGKIDQALFKDHREQASAERKRILDSLTDIQSDIDHLTKVAGSDNDHLLINLRKITNPLDAVVTDLITNTKQLFKIKVSTLDVAGPIGPNTQRVYRQAAMPPPPSNYAQRTSTCATVQNHF
jgi:hypothetical protein